MGAIYANNRNDHRTAISWFEKAVPQLGKSPPPEAMPDLARLGDTFVSMGVSYWQAGYREKAIALTEHGADLIEEAVRRGARRPQSVVDALREPCPHAPRNGRHRRRRPHAGDGRKGQRQHVAVDGQYLITRRKIARPHSANMPLPAQTKIVGRLPFFASSAPMIISG